VASKRHRLYKRQRGVCGREIVGGSGGRSGAHRRRGPALNQCYVPFPRVLQRRCSDLLAHEHHRGLGPLLGSDINSTASRTPWNNPPKSESAAQTDPFGRVCVPPAPAKCRRRREPQRTAADGSSSPRPQCWEAAGDSASLSESVVAARADAAPTATPSVSSPPPYPPQATSLFFHASSTSTVATHPLLIRLAFFCLTTDARRPPWLPQPPTGTFMHRPRVCLPPIPPPTDFHSFA